MNYYPLISIIIPVYNVCSVLKRCLDSILKQTYQNLEIILVDDGSTDGSGLICDEYLKEDKRINVIHKENGGQSSARNIGLAMASGELISFIDSDDYVELDLFEIVVNCFSKNDDVDIVQFNIIWRNSQLLLIKPLFKEPRHNHIFSSQISLQYLLECRVFTGYVANKVFRSRIVKGVSFLDGIVVEDMMFNYHVFGNANKLLCIDEKKYDYVLHEGSSSIGSVRENDIITYQKLKTFCSNEKNKKLGKSWFVYCWTFSYLLFYKMIRFGYEDNDLKKDIHNFLKRNYFMILLKKHINIKTRLMILFLILAPRMYSNFVIRGNLKKESF